MNDLGFKVWIAVCALVGLVGLFYILWAIVKFTEAFAR